MVIEHDQPIEVVPEQAEEKPRLTQRLKERSDRIQATAWTPDEIRGRWEAGAPRRQARVERLRQPLAVSLLISGALMAGAVGTGVAAQNIRQDTTVASQANEQRIVALQNQQAQLSNTTKEVTPVGDVKDYLAKAQEVGGKLTEGQNAYRLLPAGSDRSNKAGQDLVTLLDPAAKKAIEPWYALQLSSKNTNDATKLDYMWTMQRVYAYDSDNKIVKVAWMCRKPTDASLLAWAMGDFDVTKNTFKNMTWANTPMGDDYIKEVSTNGLK